MERMQKVGLFILAFIGLFYLLMYTNGDYKKDMRKVLEANGYTEIRLTGFKTMCCSDSDSFSEGFEALSPAGKPVTGCVCGGIGKGYTIRFE